MMKFQVTAHHTRTEMGGDEGQASSVRRRVEIWMSQHNPQVQGEADGKQGLVDSDGSGLLLYEQGIVESFEHEISLISHEFSEKEARLYSSFQENLAKLRPICDESGPSELDVKLDQDNDPGPSRGGIRVSSLTAKLGYLTAFVVLFSLNYVMLAPITGTVIASIAVDLGVTMAMLTTSYFMAHLLHNDNGRRWLITSMAVPVAGIVAIYCFVLLHTKFEIINFTIVLLNVAAGMLLLIMMFLSYDLKMPLPKPAKPKETKEGKDYSSELSRIAAERRNNLEYYTKLQTVFVEAAHRLINKYRISLRHSSGNQHGKALADRPLPEFKLVELHLRDEADLTPFLGRYNNPGAQGKG